LEDGPRDAPRLTLFAVAVEDVRQRLGIQRIDQHAGRLATPPVKAHVQRSIVLEAEAAFRVGQLQRRQAEIKQDPVYLVDVERGREPHHVGVAALEEVAKTGELRLETGEA